MKTKKSAKIIVIVYVIYIIYLAIMCMYSMGISFNKIFGKIKYGIHKLFNKNKYPDFETETEAELYFTEKIKKGEKSISKIEDKINRYMNRMDKHQKKVKRLKDDSKLYNLE